MRAPRRSWLVFAVCSLAVAVAMGWVTITMLRLERAELQATAAARHQEMQQAALWRMDSWLSIFLGREAARPYSDYLPYVEGETARSSPLLSFESSLIPLHFQLDVNGVTSPQAPGTLPNLAELPVTLAQLASKEQELDRRAVYLDLEQIRGAIDLAESPPATEPANPSTPSASQSDGRQTEYDARAFCSVPPAPGSAWTDGVPVDVGQLIPVWLPHPAGGEDYELVFVRRVEIGDGRVFQGFFVDWSKLKDSLLNETGPLLADVELVRVLPKSPEVDPTRGSLANLPVALIASPPSPPIPAALTPARTTLGLAWLLAMVASLAVGFTLHQSVQLSERRRQFVSAVTHELRTPLTTFRMYSEMLAGGMVPEKGQQQQYLETLKDESERLSAMVENVLTHARLEQQGGTPRVRQLTLDTLLARVTPPLHRQAEASGFTLNVQCDPPGSSPLEVDPESIAQVLSNLVDNAGKYGRNGSKSKVDLSVQLHDGSLIMKVRDHGPGVSEELAKSIFTPFDRGDRDPTDPNPGIGLGLSISSGLARDMRGDLTLETPIGPGACFRLELPASS